MTTTTDDFWWLLLITMNFASNCPSPWELHRYHPIVNFSLALTDSNSLDTIQEALGTHTRREKVLGSSSQLSAWESSLLELLRLPGTYRRLPPNWGISKGTSTKVLETPEMPGNIHKTSANWGWIESTGSSPITILMAEVLPAGKSEDSYLLRVQYRWKTHLENDYQSAWVRRIQGNFSKVPSKQIQLAWMPPYIRLRDNFFLEWKLGDSYMFVLLGVERERGKQWQRMGTYHLLLQKEQQHSWIVNCVNSHSSGTWVVHFLCVVRLPIDARDESHETSDAMDPLAHHLALLTKNLADHLHQNLVGFLHHPSITDLEYFLHCGLLSSVWSLRSHSWLLVRTLRLQILLQLHLGSMKLDSKTQRNRHQLWKGLHSPHRISQPLLLLLLLLHLSPLPTTQVSILPAFLTKLARQAGRQDRASNPNPWSSRTPILFQLRYARLWTRNNSTTDLSLSLSREIRILSPIDHCEVQTVGDFLLSTHEVVQTN